MGNKINDGIMFCPVCDEMLKSGGDKRFETLVEHVSNPNQETYPLRPTLVCTNGKCECSKVDTFWDEYGDCYGGFKINYPNNRSSAYPSHARKSEIEIYKHGLKSKIYLSPFFMLWFLQPLIEINYKSNEWGDVLKRSFKLKFLKKDTFNPFKKDRLGYHTYYTFPLVSIFKSLKYNYRVLYNGEISETYRNHSLKDMFKDLPSWDKRWWRHTEKWLSKIIFRKWYKLYLQLEKK